MLKLNSDTTFLVFAAEYFKTTIECTLGNAVMSDHLHRIVS